MTTRFADSYKLSLAFNHGTLPYGRGSVRRFPRSHMVAALFAGFPAPAWSRHCSAVSPLPHGRGTVRRFPHSRMVAALFGGFPAPAWSRSDTEPRPLGSVLKQKLALFV